MSGTISLVLSLTISLALAPVRIASLGALTRPAERDLTRTSPTDWLPDVAERLRVLESHAADAERRRIQLEPGGSAAAARRRLDRDRRDGRSRKR